MNNKDADNLVLVIMIWCVGVMVVAAANLLVVIAKLIFGA